MTYSLTTELLNCIFSTLADCNVRILLILVMETQLLWEPASPHRLKHKHRYPPCICRTLQSESWRNLHRCNVLGINVYLPRWEGSRCGVVCVKLDRWSWLRGIRHTRAVFIQLWFLRLERPEGAPCLGWGDFTQTTRRCLPKRGFVCQTDGVSSGKINARRS